MMVLADAVADHESASELLRLGILLPLGLVASTAVLARRIGGSRAGTVVAMLAAGLLHLLLAPTHLRDGAAEGAFFIATAVAELGLAVLAWRGNSRVVLIAPIVLLEVAVYAATRLVALPLVGEREQLDGIGLITKALEVTALALVVSTNLRRRPAIPIAASTAAVVAALALVARPLLSVGPSVGVVAAAIIAAVTVTALLGQSTGMAATVSDASVLALVMRSGGVAAFAFVGMATAVLRWTRRFRGGEVIAPAPATALGVLAISALGFRSETLHAGHAEDALAALVVFVVSGLVAVACWQRGALGAVVAFYAVHLVGQFFRVWAGHTSIEAVEIPATSLGLLLLVTIGLAGVADRDAVEVGILAALIAGAADVALRDAGFAYPAFAAVCFAVAVAAARRWFSAPNSRRPVGSVRTEHASQARPRGT